MYTDEEKRNGSVYNKTKIPNEIVLAVNTKALLVYSCFSLLPREINMLLRGEA
jgi:hypothetical protein